METLITALYVKIDDELVTDRWCGRPPLLGDSELVCLAVAQALLQVHNEARWLRFVGQRLGGLFPYRPKRPGYNKRLRAALPLVKRVIRLLARDTDYWLDNVWITDSTPVPCGMSRPTVKRSNLAGWASYGYCASHSRFFWGLRLFLVCTPSGMPVLWALANAKLGEREVLEAMLEEARDVVAEHRGVLMVTDKGFSGKRFAQVLKEDHGIELLRPSRKGENKRSGESLLKSVRQLIESVNDTLARKSAGEWAGRRHPAQRSAAGFGFARWRGIRSAAV